MREEVVVITGASAGVGRATAQAFGKRKARVGLIARGRDGLEAAKREIEAAGGSALVLPLDVSDHDAVEQAASEVEKTFGPIDIWINDAMLSVFSPIMQMQPDEYRRVTDARSCRSDRRSPIAEFRCSPRIAPPNTQYKASMIRFAAN